MQNNNQKIELSKKLMSLLTSYSVVCNVNGSSRHEEIRAKNASKFMKVLEEVKSILTQVELTNQEIEQLAFAKQYKNNMFASILNLEDLNLVIEDMNNEVIESTKYIRVLSELLKYDKDTFQKFVKDNPQIIEKYKKHGYSNSPFYEELLEDNVFANLDKMDKQVEQFKNGEIKLADVDDSILQNDYNMNRICQAITEKLYTAFRIKLENANTPEQEMKIKEMLDKKIESTVADLQVRRENSLQQDQNKVEEEIKKYEI